MAQQTISQVAVSAPVSWQWSLPGQVSAWPRPGHAGVIEETQVRQRLQALMQGGMMTMPRLIELCADKAFEQMAQGGDLFVNGDHFEALLFGVWIKR